MVCSSQVKYMCVHLYICMHLSDHVVTCILYSMCMYSSPYVHVCIYHMTFPSELHLCDLVNGLSSMHYN